MKTKLFIDCQDMPLFMEALNELNEERSRMSFDGFELISDEPQEEFRKIEIECNGEDMFFLGCRYQLKTLLNELHNDNRYTNTTRG